MDAHSVLLLRLIASSCTCIGIKVTASKEQQNLKFRDRRMLSAFLLLGFCRSVVFSGEALEIQLS